MSYILIPARRPALRTGTAVADNPPEPGEQWTPLFFSDWHNPVPQLGTSQAAHRDDQDTGVGTNYKWNSNEDFAPYSTNGTSLTSIIAAPSGVGWPCAKVMRIICNADGALFNVGRVLPNQQIGEVRGYRFYHHPRWGDAGNTTITGSGRHGIQFDGGNTSSSNANLTVVPEQLNPVTAFCSFNWLMMNSGQRFEYGPGTGGGTNSIQVAHQVLRFEFQTELLTSSTFRCIGWLYQADDTLLAAPADWHRQTSPNPDLTEVTSHPTQSGVPLGRNFLFGLNGLIMTGTTPVIYADQGAVAIVSSLDNPAFTYGTPIGPYGSCVGEVPV